MQQNANSILSTVIINKMKHNNVVYNKLYIKSRDKVIYEECVIILMVSVRFIPKCKGL